MPGPKTGSCHDSRSGPADAGSDLVILRCPACGAAEPVKSASVAERRQMIRCRRCGTHWPARADTAPASVDPRKQSVVWADAGAIDDIRRPLVGYADDSDPWAAQRAPKPEPKQRASRNGAMKAVASTLAFAFLAGAVVGREAAVAAVPDLAGLYAVVGLPVNLVGLDIAGVSGSRRVTGQAVRLTASGEVLNAGPRTRAVPGLVISIHDEAGRQLGEQRIPAPVPSLDSGAAVRFVVDLERAPREASAIRARFDRSSPDGGSGMDESNLGG